MKKVKEGFSSKEEKILYYIFSCTILLDFLNGVFSEFPIGEMSRILIMIVLIIIILRCQTKQLSYIIVMIIYLSLNVMIAYLKSNNLFGLVFDSKMLLKAIYFVIIYKAFKAVYNSRKLKKNIVEKIILNNLYYTPMLFVLSNILEVGKYSYESNSLGFKGAFLSLNSINIAMIILFIFSMNKLLEEKNKIKWLILNVYIILPMVLLGTKSSLIFLVFTIFMYVILNIKKMKTLIIVVWGMIFLIIGIILFIRLDISMGYFEQLLERQKYLFQNRDLITYLLSGRNWLLDIGFQNFSNDLSLGKLLFGEGYFTSHNNIAISFFMELNDVRPVELDIMDILFAYGCVGITFTYGYYFKGSFPTYKNAFKRQVQPYFLSLLTLLIFSLFGGHVFLEAISSTFLGLCLIGGKIQCLEEGYIEKL